MGIAEAAAARIAQQYDPQQASVERRIGSSRTVADARNAGLTDWGVTGTGAINNVYDTNVDPYLASNRTKTMAGLNQGVADVGSIYASGQDVGTAAKQQSLDWLGNYAGQTGMQGHTAGTMSNLLAALDRNIAGSASAGAAVQGWLKAQATGFDNQLAAGQNIAKASRGKNISDLQTAVAKAIAENNLGAQQNENDLNSRLTDILGERGNALTAEVDRLTQQAWEHAIEQGKLDAQNAQNASSDALGWARLNQDASNSSWDQFLGLQKIGQDSLDRQTVRDQQDFTNTLSTRKQNLDERTATDSEVASIFGSLVEKDPDTGRIVDVKSAFTLYNELRRAHGLSLLNLSQFQDAIGDDGKGGSSSTKPLPKDLANIPRSTGGGLGTVNPDGTVNNAPSPYSGKGIGGGLAAPFVGLYHGYNWLNDLWGFNVG